MSRLSKEEQQELQILKGLQANLHKKAEAYIEEHGIDKYLALPAHQSFKLNYVKYNRLIQLEEKEIGTNIFGDEW